MGPTSQAAANKRSGLGADDGEIGVLGRLGVLGGGELHHFALGDHRGGAGKHLETGERANFDHHLEGLAQEEIADQNARLVAPKHPRRVLAAPHVALVDDVVVKEGRGVHEFDRGGELDVALAAIAAKARRRQGQDRTHPFSPRGDKVVGDLRDHRHLRSRPRQNGLIDLGHVASDERSQRLDQAIGRFVFERNDNSHASIPLPDPAARP